MERSKSIIRIDRNMVDNALTWFKKLGEHSYLCFDILLYITNSVQRDIFKYGFIDPRQFAKQFGYKLNNLQAIDKSSDEKKAVNEFLMKKEREERYITNFEKALNKLGLYNLPYSHVEIDPIKGTPVVVTDYIQIITETRIHQSKNKNKIVYSYRTSEEFDRSIARLFFLGDFNIFSSLRSKKLILLYFYLKSLENQGYDEFLEKDFIKLCNFANINVNSSLDENENSKSIRFAKANLKRRKLDPIKEFINYTYEEVNVSGKYKYGFKFCFPENKKALTEKEKMDAKVEKYIILQDAENDFIFTKLIKFYKSSIEPNSLCVNPDEFISWFLDPQKNSIEKNHIYYSSIQSLTKETLETVKSKYSHALKRFFSTIPENVKAHIDNNQN